MGKLIKRELVHTIPGTYLAEYRETYDDGFVGLVTISYLWDDDEYSLCGTW